MKTEYLKYFEVLARVKNFSDAAEECYISQSSLSKDIAALEAELGGSLFDRKTNGVRLSAFGEYLEYQIHNLNEDLALLYSEAEQYLLANKSVLHFATFYNLGFTGCMRPVIEFEKQESNFYIETSETDHQSLKSLLRSGNTDACIGYHELIGNIDGYHYTPLFAEPLVLITGLGYAKSHHLYDNLQMYDLRDEVFCFQREDLLLYDFFISACRKAKFRPELTLSNVRLTTIREYVMNDMRCTLHLDRQAQYMFGEKPNVVIYRIADAPMLTCSLYIKDNASGAAVERFEKSIKTYYQIT